MYTNDKSFSFKDLIIKIIFLGLFVLLLVWLFPKVNMKPFYSNVFRENISYMQEAAKSYFTTDKLPIELYESTKLSLKEMEDKNLIIPFIDKDGNSCNLYESYAEVTKEANGYKLKVQLTCNTESDFVVEVLGCYDYGCNTCSSTSKETAIEYEFIKSFSKKITSTSCPSGYKKSGSSCTKVLDIIPAKENYIEGYNLYFPILYKDGEKVKIQLATKITTTTEQIKTPIDVIKTPVIDNQCTNTTVPDPNCKVQCVMKFINGRYVESCNTCGTITVEDCNDVTTGYTYSCPSSADGSTGSGSTLKCYTLSTKEVKSYSCPSDATERTGSGSTLKCYKYIDGEKIPYCENPKAQPNITIGKCVLGVGSEFSHYSCPSKDYTLDIKAKTCTKIDIKKLISNSYTKKWTQTKWSTSKTLSGWTATGKTRIIEVK